MVTVGPEEAYEWGAAIEGRRLGEAMDLMNRLDSLTGYTSPSSRERVQGGDHLTLPGLPVPFLSRDTPERPQERSFSARGIRLPLALK